MTEIRYLIKIGDKEFTLTKEELLDLYAKVCELLPAERRGGKDELIRRLYEAGRTIEDIARTTRTGKPHIYKVLRREGKIE